MTGGELGTGSERGRRESCKHARGYKGKRGRAEGNGRHDDSQRDAKEGQRASNTESALGAIQGRLETSEGNTCQLCGTRMEISTSEVLREDGRGQNGPRDPTGLSDTWHRSPRKRNRSAGFGVSPSCARWGCAGHRTASVCRFGGHGVLSRRSVNMPSRH